MEFRQIEDRQNAFQENHYPGEMWILKMSTFVRRCGVFWDRSVLPRVRVLAQLLMLDAENQRGVGRVLQRED